MFVTEEYKKDGYHLEDLEFDRDYHVEVIKRKEDDELMMITLGDGPDKKTITPYEYLAIRTVMENNYSDMFEDRLTKEENLSK